MSGMLPKQLAFALVAAATVCPAAESFEATAPLPVFRDVAEQAGAA